MADESNLPYVKEPVNLDKTQKKISATLEQVNASIQAQNGLLAQIVRQGAPSLSMSWADVRAIVRQGIANLVFSIGDRFIVKWSDGTTVYDVPHDVLAFGTAVDSAGVAHPKMTLGWHYTLPFNTCYNSRQAFYVAGDGGLPAGTYNITMGYSQGTVVKDKTYQFTLEHDLPEGGQLLGFIGAWDNKPESWKVNSYTDCRATSATESVSVTEGTEGTSLGTFLSTKPNGDLNSLQRAAYGSNDPEKCALTQYLNSDAADFSKVWQPQSKFDHYPCDSVSWGPYGTRGGFMAGYDEEFLDVIGLTRVDTCKNYVCDGGTSAEPNMFTEYVKFYIPSLEQNYIKCNESSVNGKEGEPFPYFEQAAGTSERLPLWTTQPQMRTYAINGKTSPQSVFLRSPNRIDACYVFYVRSSGYLYSTYAASGYRVRPACDIF